MKLDWVEIPAGEFIYGEEIDVLLSHLYTTLEILSKQAFQAPNYEEPFEQVRAAWVQDCQLKFEPLVALARVFGPREDASLIGAINRIRNLYHLSSGVSTPYVDTFYISRYPITVEQFLEYFDDIHNYKLSLRDIAGGRSPEIRYPELPIGVHYEYAQGFCKWMKTDLPTAQEWEKAARGTDGRLYPWGNEWHEDYGNFVVDPENPRQRESYERVKTYKRPSTDFPNNISPYGVMDMAGNVSEWTQSVTSIYDSPSQIMKSRHVLAVNDAWLYEPPSFHQMSFHVQPGIQIIAKYVQYYGFRPVKRKWDKQIW